METIGIKYLVLNTIVHPNLATNVEFLVTSRLLFTRTSDGNVGANPSTESGSNFDFIKLDIDFENHLIVKGGEFDGWKLGRHSANAEGYNFSKTFSNYSTMEGGVIIYGRLIQSTSKQNGEVLYIHI